VCLAPAIAGICTLMAFAPAAQASTPLAPANTSAPALTGTPSPGHALSCSQGSWTNDPSHFAYAWLRNGSPIADATGSIYTVQEADEGASIACEVTASVLGSAYTITGLPSETYVVSFKSNFEAGGNFLAQYFNDKPSAAEATPISVAAPGDTSEIDADLSAGGEIAGKVTDEAGAPLVEADVCARAGTGGESCDRTDANGEYTIVGLPAGGYKVHFEDEQCDKDSCVDEYATQYYNGKTNASDAEEVAVTPPNATTGIDAVLTLLPTGQISGKVEGGGGVLERVDVCALSVESAFAPPCVETDSSGEYTIPNLQVGKYTVLFDPTSEIGNYVYEYYSGKFNPSQATQVQVAASSTTSDIDGSLEEGGWIEGQARSESTGKPIEGVEVCAHEVDSGFSPACSKTNGFGYYSIPGVQVGSYYQVQFSDYDGAYLPYEVQGVAVEGPYEYGYVDGELEEGGRISGRVSGSGGAAIAEGEVCAKDKALGAAGCAFTDAAGEYTIEGLETGSYEVAFRDEQCNESGCSETYLEQAYGESVSVTNGEATANVDAALAEGGRITGVAFAASTPSGVRVCAEPTGPGRESSRNEFFKCALVSEAVGAASSALSSADAVLRPRGGPGPSPLFRLVKKRFDAKTGKLDLFLKVFRAGTLRWDFSFNATGGRKVGKAHGKGHASSSTSFGKGSRKVATGSVEIEVKASAKAAKALRSGKVLHIKGEVSLKSTSNGLEAAEFDVIAHPAKHAKQKHKRHKK
jgi:hypothetical protein